MVSPEVNWNGNVTPHALVLGGVVAESGLANIDVPATAIAIEAAHQLGSHALDNVEYIPAVRKQLAA